MVKLGHIALDGTKVKANASRHKAMSYGRMEKKAAELEQQVKDLLVQAEDVDKDEDAKYGGGKKDNDLPKELKFRQTRLQKLQAAKKALEKEGAAEAARRQSEYEAKKTAYDKKTGRRGRPPKPPSDRPDPKKQRNFTDPESRIMPVSGGKDFVQGYNCQAAVDKEAQIIVAAHVTQATNDKQQVLPLISGIVTNTDNDLSKIISADAGYFSEANCTKLAERKVDAYIATGKLKHGATALPPLGRIANSATSKQRMTRKLKTVKGGKAYSLRKHIVEPVFGQIKEARNFRRFSLRGLASCRDEWNLVCLTHNLLKLFRAGYEFNRA